MGKRARGPHGTLGGRSRRCKALVTGAIAVCLAGSGVLYWQGRQGDASGTVTETRPIRMTGVDGLVLGDGEYTSENGYYTLVSNDSNIIVYDASCYDEVFDGAADDVTLDVLDATIDANAHIPDDFRAVAHDYCEALVSQYPNADLRVLLHNLEQLTVAYESLEDIKGDIGDETAGGYFDRVKHRIVLPKDADYSRGSWGREAAYHELAHATRLYYGENDEGVSTWVCFSAPDDATDSAEEALNELLALSLMDERPVPTSYQLPCNYATAIIDSLDGYSLEGYLSHSSQWLTRELDDELGEDGGQMLLELMQLQKDDLSDDFANAPDSSTDALLDELSQLYFRNRVSGSSTYEDARGVADELVSTLTQGLGDAKDEIDVHRIYRNLRERCRDLGVEGVPDEEPEEERTTEPDVDGTAPEGVAYLASFTDRPQATYEVLGYGSEGGGTRSGEDSDRAAEQNNALRSLLRQGGGQYLALYPDGSCRLFMTSGNGTADVSTGYWDADDGGDLRNFTLSDAYFDEGVFQTDDGTMVATGSSNVTMLCKPSDYDVRGLKPYHTALRTRTEGYEEHNAFEGGWSFASLAVEDWVTEGPEHPGVLASEPEAYRDYQERIANIQAGVASLAEALDDTIAAGGYQRIYIDGGGMWRMASDGTTTQRVLEGRFEPLSLARATCEPGEVDDHNPLASDADVEGHFDLVDGDTLVEHRGCYKITYHRDATVHDPRNDEETAPKVEVSAGKASVGNVEFELPDGLSYERSTDEGALFEDEDRNVLLYVSRDLPMPTDDIMAEDVCRRTLTVSLGATGTWESDWDPEPVEVDGAQMAVRGKGTYAYRRFDRSDRYHALMLRVQGYTYYVYAVENGADTEQGSAEFPLEEALETALDSVAVIQ